LASLAALDTPAKPDDSSTSSPISTKTPTSKKQKSPEKKKSVETEISSSPSVPLPKHYQRLVDDLRILEETLSIFRVKNQVPFFSLIKENIERVSGRRFSLDNLRQLMTATSGDLFRLDWQEVKDVEGKLLKMDLTVRAIDNGVEMFKRMTSEQSQQRINLLQTYLNQKLSEYMKTSKDADIQNAYPIKPCEVPEKPQPSTGGDQTPSHGRARVLARCDSVASNGSAVQTPKSSLRRQLSVSASPIIPNTLPQFITPVKLPRDSQTVTSTSPRSSSMPPMSAKEKLDAIRNRVRAKEAEDVAEAKQYDKEMELREKLDEFDLCVRLLVKLNHKFPRGISTAKISTIQKDYGSMFVHPGDTEKWCKKLCSLVPHHFEMEKIGSETIMKFKSSGTEIKFSAIKQEIEEMKKQFKSAENVVTRE
jgi:hypothetical protein